MGIRASLFIGLDWTRLDWTEVDWTDQNSCIQTVNVTKAAAGCLHLCLELLHSWLMHCFLNF